MFDEKIIKIHERAQKLKDIEEELFLNLNIDQRTKDQLLYRVAMLKDRILELTIDLRDRAKPYIDIVPESRGVQIIFSNYKIEEKDTKEVKIPILYLSAKEAVLYLMFLRFGRININSLRILIKSGGVNEIILMARNDYYKIKYPTEDIRLIYTEKEMRENATKEVNDIILNKFDVYCSTINRRITDLLSDESNPSERSIQASVIQDICISNRNGISNNRNGIKIVNIDPRNMTFHF